MGRQSGPVEWEHRRLAGGAGSPSCTPNDEPVQRFRSMENGFKKKKINFLKGKKRGSVFPTIRGGLANKVIHSAGTSGRELVSGSCCWGLWQLQGRVLLLSVPFASTDARRRSSKFPTGGGFLGY